MVSLGAGRKSSDEARQEGKKIEERKAAVLSSTEASWTGSCAGTIGRLLMDSVGVAALGCLTLATLERQSIL